MGVRVLVVLLLVSAASCESGPGLAAPGPVAVTSGASPAPAVPRLQKPDASPVHRTVFEAGKETFPPLPDAHVAVQIRAEVNGVAILDEEVRDACYPMLVSTLHLPEPERSAAQAEIFRKELDHIIDREILLQDAYARLSKNASQFLDKLKAAAAKEFDKRIHAIKKRAGCKTDEELVNLLKAQGQSLERLRRQAEKDFIATEYLKQRVFPAVERVGRQQILQYYQDHAADFQVQDSVRWQDVFIDASRFPNRDDARRFAERLVERARAGEVFSWLSQYDTGDSSYRGGEGLGRRRGEIRPVEAEPVLFQLKDGQVGPVIEIATGFHVVRVIKRTRAGQTPLDEKTQADIRRKLQGQAFEREAKRLIAELRSKSTVEIAPVNP